jgi:hypothetical protein
VGDGESESVDRTDPARAISHGTFSVAMIAPGRHGQSILSHPDPAGPTGPSRTVRSNQPNIATHCSAVLGTKTKLFRRVWPIEADASDE